MGLRVAIVGAGVGGLTAAIALTRKGIDCAVYEQAPGLSATGASLQLGPNALRLMDELGLLGRLREIGVRPEAVDFVRWDDGSLLLHTPLGAAMEDTSARRSSTSTAPTSITCCSTHCRRAR